MQQIPLLITPKYWAPPYNVWSPGRPGPRHLCFHPPPPRSALHYDNTWLRVQYMALLVTIHGTACYNTWHFLLQYMALLVTIHGTACYDTWHCLLQYMALLVTIHGTACYNTWHFLLQYMALLVTIHGTACCDTWHCLLQYMALLVTIHGTACYNTWHCLLQYMALLVTIHGTSCYNTWYCLLQYMALLVTIHGTSCYNTWHCLLQYMGLLVTIHGTSCYNTWHFLLQYMALLVTIHGTSCYNTWHFLLYNCIYVSLNSHLSLWSLSEFSSQHPRSPAPCLCVLPSGGDKFSSSYKATSKILVYTSFVLTSHCSRTNRLWSTRRAGAWGRWGVVPSLNSALDVSGSFTLWPLYHQRKSPISMAGWDQVLKRKISFLCR